MQEPLTSTPTWLSTAFGWVASFVAGGTIFKLIDLWLNRKKPQAEIEVVEATAQEITVRSHLTAGEALAKMMDRLDQAQTTIDRLRSERDTWEMKAFDLQVELRDSRKEVGQLTVQAHLDLHQIKKLKATLDYHSISYAELDHPPTSPD